MDELLNDPAMRLFAIVSLVLVAKMAVVGSYTSILRIGRKVYATPEDYQLQGMAPAARTDADIERVRRAHRNDLENILPFFAVGFFYALTNPSLLMARIYFVGFALARILHSVFYIRSVQPHRTIAFAVGAILMLAMLLSTLATLLTAA
jgi:glutathione S-transferase